MRKSGLSEFKKLIPASPGKRPMGSKCTLPIISAYQCPKKFSTRITLFPRNSKGGGKRGKTIEEGSWGMAQKTKRRCPEFRVSGST